MRLVFDIEANNLLWDVDELFCIVTKDIDTGEVCSFDPSDIDEAISKLNEADTLIGHNIIGYDIPALEKLRPDFNYNGEVIDTLVLSRMVYSRMKGHGLKAWGQRFVDKGMMKLGKLDYDNFSYYEPDMLTYCEQDVEVTATLFKVLDKATDVEHESVKLEQDILDIQTRSETYGVTFNYDDAMKLAQKISTEMEDIRDKVEEALGFAYEEKVYALKKNRELNHHAVNLINKIERDFGYVPTAEITESASILQLPTKITLDTKKILVEKLLEMGWECSWFTDRGSPQLTRSGEVEPNISSIQGLEGVDLGRYYILKHRLALVKGFFVHVRSDGKIPSEANTLGAITGRYTHRKIANLPADRSLYGKEIRSLFGVDEGRVQVGADLAGIEARLLAHYMDDPDYTKEVLDGDIHTANQIAAGLPTRDSAKTFFYGFLYGAGDAKVGQLVNGGAKEGKKVKEQFLKSLPSLDKLIKQKQKEAEQGYVISLDGRKVNITKSIGYQGVMEYDSRKALNSLLQSAGAIYFKRWVVYVDKLARERGLGSHLMISYHDEGQWSVHHYDVDWFKDVLQDALELTDKYYKVKCPNAIDIKTGHNWYDTH